MSNSLWLHEPQHTRPSCHHQLLEFTQTHVHWVVDAIQPSHPLSSPSPPALNLSQHQFSSVQSLSHVQLFENHESQHARPPCPSPSPGVHSDSRSSSPWCHQAISSSVVPFSSCPQSLPASVFSNESTLRMRWPKYWSVSFSIIPSKEILQSVSFVHPAPKLACELNEVKYAKYCWEVGCGLRQGLKTVLHFLWYNSAHWVLPLVAVLV